MTVGTKPTRDGFGEGLLDSAAANSRVVAIGSDISDSVRTGWFAEKYPDRFISLGIAEQNAAGVAAGLALAGLIPVTANYGVFASGRCFDQIRTSICYPNLNVKICGAHGGISVGPDGATHQALSEIALMRVLPNMTLIVPCDSNQTRKATASAILEVEGPVYIRTGREPIPLFTSPNEPFEIGKAIVRREGGDIAIIACGAMVYESLRAADILEKHGISARVVDLHTIKPIDKAALIESAQCGAIITVEEHQRHAGMGSAVAEVVVENCPVPMKIIGIDDRFGESGTPEELLEHFGLTAE
ncbi:MAG: transketolase family protein, partial [bacterium]